MIKFKPFVLVLLAFLWTGTANAQHSEAACKAAEKELFRGNSTEASRQAPFGIWNSESCQSFREPRKIAFDKLNQGIKKKASETWGINEPEYLAKCEASVEKRWREGGPKFRREQNKPELMQSCMSQSEIIHITKVIPIWKENPQSKEIYERSKEIYEVRKEALEMQKTLFVKNVNVHESDCVQWRQRNSDLNWSSPVRCPRSDNKIDYVEPKTEQEYQSLLTEHDQVRQRFDRDLKAHAGACASWGREHEFSDDEIERRCLLAI